MRGMDLISQVTAPRRGMRPGQTLVELRWAARGRGGAARAALLERDARGRYALATTRPALRVANRVSGVLSHRSAAQYWGWAQKAPPPAARGHVSPRPTGRPGPAQGARAALVRPRTGRRARARDVRVRTLVDCMRNLPLRRGRRHREQRRSGPTTSPSRRAADRRDDPGPWSPAHHRGGQRGDGSVRQPVRVRALRPGMLVPGLDVRAAARRHRARDDAQVPTRPR